MRLGRGGSFEIAPNDLSIANEEALAGGESWAADGNAEGFDHLPLLVSEQGKREIEFLGEGFLVFRGVGADAEDGDAGFLDGFEFIPKVAGLLGASWGVGFGIEVDEGGPLRKRLAQVDLFPILVRGDDGRGFRPDFEWFCMEHGEREKKGERERIQEFHILDCRLVEFLGHGEAPSEEGRAFS